MTGIDTTSLVRLEVIELPEHAGARQLLGQQLLEPSPVLLLAPQVLCEFVHIVTDPRRFQVPLSMDEAVSKANFW